MRGALFCIEFMHISIGELPLFAVEIGVFCCSRGHNHTTPRGGNDVELSVLDDKNNGGKYDERSIVSVNSAASRLGGIPASPARCAAFASPPLDRIE